VSLILVSSKPGVSIRVTARRSILKGSVICISSVQDSSSLPILKPDPLSKFINYKREG